MTSPSTPLMNVTGSMDKLHRPLAPLASSETFSDVGSIYNEEQKQKKGVSMNNGLKNSEKIPTRITKNTDFDSLEILFDFPSVDLSTDSPNEIVRPPGSPCRIRFSENTEIINTTKV